MKGIAYCSIFVLTLACIKVKNLDTMSNSYAKTDNSKGECVETRYPKMVEVSKVEGVVGKSGFCLESMSLGAETAKIIRTCSPIKGTGADAETQYTHVFYDKKMGSDGTVVNVSAEEVEKACPENP